MHVIPQSWSHLHILVSVFPSVGLLFVLGFYIAALIVDNEVMKRICLVLIAILALLAVPTYFSGEHSMELLSQDPKISKDLMGVHLGWGVVSLLLLALTGLVALIELWRVSAGRLSDNALHFVVGVRPVTPPPVVLAWRVRRARSPH